MAALVRAGLGVWNYRPPSARGGRSARQFVLTARPEFLEPLLRMARKSEAPSPRPARQIARDLTAYLNRYAHVRCQVLAEALAEVNTALSDLVKSEGEVLLPEGRRYVSMNARGSVDASWELS